MASSALLALSSAVYSITSAATAGSPRGSFDTVDANLGPTIDSWNQLDCAGEPHRLEGGDCVGGWEAWGHDAFAFAFAFSVFCCACDRVGYPNGTELSAETLWQYYLFLVLTVCTHRWCSTFYVCALVGSHNISQDYVSCSRPHGRATVERWKAFLRGLARTKTHHYHHYQYRYNF